MLVQILSAPYGEGHRRAARALKSAIEKRNPAWEVQVSDFVHLLHPSLDALMRVFYLQCVSQAPFFYDWFYRFTDKPEPRSGCYLSDYLGFPTMQRLLRAMPDVVVATFPTPGRICGEIKIRKKLKFPLVMVITDFAVHAEWCHPAVDLYLVATGDVKVSLEKRGVPPERILPVGIPVHPEFEEPVHRTRARAALGLRNDLPVVLVAGGSYARLGDVGRVARELLRFQNELQVVVLTGRDCGLYRKLSRELGSCPNFKIIGYTERVAPVMSAADLIITKAGALTLAEAAALGLPVLIHRWVGGQEAANASYFVQKGAALAAYGNNELLAKVEFLLSAPDGFREQMREKGRLVQPPGAAARGAAAIARLAEAGL
ncbi:MAG: glycosyltransferase [Firmicutes bacterium]|nr:glycosyltransferase [Bacillota bacterium]